MPKTHHVTVNATVSGVTGVSIVGNLAVAEGDDTLQAFGTLSDAVGIKVQGFIVPERRTADGILVRGVPALWYEIVNVLGKDWNRAFDLTDRQWEEIIGAAFKKAGYDDVTVTPHKGDHGRDVIAIKHGVGSVKIVDSMKAYKPSLIVPAKDVRELAGVVGADLSVSKGILTTTSSFAPELLTDSGIKAMVPHRLELIDGPNLLAWLTDLAKK